MRSDRTNANGQQPVRVLLAVADPESRWGRDEVLVDCRCAAGRGAGPDFLQFSEGIGGRACLRILNRYHELEHAPAGLGLQRLIRLVDDGKLTPHLGVEADWSEIGQVAQALIDRRFQGKAVLHIPS